MRVAYDIDGVTATFEVPCNFWLASYLGVEPRPVDRWDFYWNYEVDAGPEQVKEAWKRFWKHASESDFFANLPVLPGAQAGVKALRANGHEVFFLTARNERYREVTLSWLRRHGLLTAWSREDPERLVLDNTKHNHEFDLLVDDKPANVSECEANGRRAVLFDQPWNRSSLGLRRVFSHEAVVAYVEALSKRVVNAR